MSNEHSTFQRNIVIIGKVNQGKTATINSIKKHSGNSNSSVEGFEKVSADSRSFKEANVILAGLDYRIFDTNSFFDPDWYLEKSQLSNDAYHIVDPEEPHKMVLEQVQTILEHLNGGIGAVLFVLNGTERFTREAKESISVIKRYFGNELLDRTVFVLTHVDLAADGFSRMQDVVRTYVGTIGYPGNLSERFLDFDNSSNPPHQIDELVKKIEAVISMYKPYVISDFRNAQCALKEEKQNLMNEKEKAMQKQLEEEKRKVKQEYSKGIKQLKEQLNEKQLELDTLVEKTSNQHKLTTFDKECVSFAESNQDQSDWKKACGSSRQNEMFPFTTELYSINPLTVSRPQSTTVITDAVTLDGMGKQESVSPTSLAPRLQGTSNEKTSFSSYHETPDVTNKPYAFAEGDDCASSRLDLNLTYRSNQTKYPSDPIHFHPDNELLPQTKSSNSVYLEKSLAVDQTLADQKRINDAKLREMENTLKVRTLMLEEHYTEIGQLQEDVKRLTEQPTYVVQENKTTSNKFKKFFSGFKSGHH